MSILLEKMRELRRRYCLARPVHARDQNYFWFIRKRLNWFQTGWQDAQDFVAGDFDDIIDPGQRPGLALLQRADDPRRHRHSQIRADKRFFELVPVDWLIRKRLLKCVEEVHSLVSSLVMSSEVETSLTAL